MGESQFLYIKTAKAGYEKFPWYIPRKGKWNYLWRKFPYIQRELEVLGRKGKIVELPFTREELEEKDTGVRSDILYRLQVETGISYLAIEKESGKLFPFEWVCDGKELPLYMAEKILDEIGYLEKIPKKSMHIVILAGDDSYTDFILKKLGAVYNYLTLAAEQKELYQDTLCNLYEEYGLAVSFMDRQSLNTGAFRLSGDIFVDLTGKDNSYCRLLPKDAKAVDLLGEKDIRYYQGKREDIKLYNGFSFGKEREIPSGLLQAVLGQESGWLMRGALEDYNALVQKLDLKVLAVKSCFS